MGGRSWLIFGYSAYPIHMHSEFKWKGILSLLRSPMLLVWGILLTWAMEGWAQEQERGEICLVWYNAENLFYPGDDTIAGDDEFTPEGPRHWTWTRYRDKLTALARVIIASGRGEPPELVGLCEVENALVLEDLCSHPILRPYTYTYLHRESRDHRGMDVACLVRKERIRIFQWECRAFSPPVRETRDVMHICLSWNTDSLDLFLVHLMSKYRGAGATAELRREQIWQLVQLMDSVYAERQDGRIMVAGDFNADYRAFSMEPLRNARFGGDSLALFLPAEGCGSYKFQGLWSPIDQLLVQQSFPGMVRVGSLRIRPLLTEDLQYGGKKPRRCYEGFQYRGGISDHLPLLIDLFQPSFPDPGSL
jgi:endonuclease/exonuclease/phosphatase family metal-dependent hydrolase